MKKVLEFLKLTGIEVLFLVLIVIFNYLVPMELATRIGMNQFQLLILAVSGLIFAAFFFKYLNLGNLKRSVSWRSIFLSIGLALLLWNADVFIGILGTDMQLPQAREFSFGMVFLLVIVVPVIEEYVSRIILIDRFRRVLHPLILILSTSLFFSVLHIRDLNLWVSSLFYGLVLSTFYVATQNSFVLVLTHVVYNFLNLVFGSVLIGLNQALFPYFLSIWHYITLLVSLGLLAFWFYRNRLWKKVIFK